MVKQYLKSLKMVKIFFSKVEALKKTYNLDFIKMTQPNIEYTHCYVAPVGNNCFLSNSNLHSGYNPLCQQIYSKSLSKSKRVAWKIIIIM